MNIPQSALSDLENGYPIDVPPARIDALLRRLSMGDMDGHAEFLKHWPRINEKL